MKQFLVQVGIAVVLALGGVLTGYLLVSAERNTLQEELATKTSECASEAEMAARELEEANRQIALRNAIVFLHQAKRDIGEANYGLANQRLDAATNSVESAADGALDTFASSMNVAKDEIATAKALVNEQSEEAPTAIENIIRSLEPQ